MVLFFTGLYAATVVYGALSDVVRDHLEDQLLEYTEEREALKDSAVCLECEGTFRIVARS